MKKPLERRRRDKREDFEKRSSIFYANVNCNWPLGLTIVFLRTKCLFRGDMRVNESREKGLFIDRLGAMRLLSATIYFHASCN